MFRPALIISTFFALVLAAHGPDSALAQSPQQVQQREAQERAEGQRRADAERQREAGERLEQQRRAQGLAESQRDIEERIARHQRDEQREAEESMVRQRRARSLADEQREVRVQAELLVQRRAQAEAERQRQIQQQAQGQGQPPDSRVASPEPMAQPESPAKPQRVLSPALLAFVGSCVLAGVSLFMLSRIVLQRFTHR
jgi:colicin import membrane protein